MTNYRIFLLSFLTVSWIFLSGLNKPVDNDMSTEETQKTEVELKSIETENNTRKLLETKQVKAKSNVKSVKANPNKQQSKQQMPMLPMTIIPLNVTSLKNLWIFLFRLKTLKTQI